MTTLTPREVHALHFAVRADRQALSHTRIVSAVEEIVAARLAAIEALAEGWDAADEHGNLLREGSLDKAADDLRAALGGAS